MIRLKKRNIAWVLVFSAVVALAQEAEVQPVGEKPKPKGHAFLAGGDYGNESMVPLAQFDSLIGLPLVARDSLGRLCQVVKYNFTFAERGLFEDSTGKLIIMTDYFTTTSDSGAVLPQFWVNELRRRAKVGDTIYFDNVLATYPDSVNAKHFYAFPAKLILAE